MATISVAPGQDWDGTRGSGFGSIPTDPGRTTAKPILRLITVPNRRFAQKALVGVRAAANNSGTLFDTDGLSLVRVHYEGNTVDIASPSIRTIVGADGVARCFWGWWCDLEYTGDGTTEVYFEAIPLDSTMQTRVIGPYIHHPNAVEWDLEVSVDPDAAEVVGSNYHTLNGALTWLKVQGANGQCRVRIQKAGQYSLADQAWNRALDAGWLVVEGMVDNVSLVQPLDTNNLPTFFRPRIEPICYRRMTIDFAGANEYYFEPGWVRENWFDGCKLINSVGRLDTQLKKPRSSQIYSAIRGKHWVTECEFRELWNSAVGQRLVRGCKFDGCWSDLANDAEAFIGNIVLDFDGEIYRQGVAALSVQYTGSANSATMQGSGNGTRLFTLAQEGSAIGTFTAYSAKAAQIDDTNYTVQNLADWINSQPDWSATVLDDSFAAFALCLDDGSTPGVGFAAQDTKSAPLVLHTKFDIHADIYQTGDGAVRENIAICENRMWGVSGQVYFLAGNGGCNDALIVNNAVDIKAGTVALSQFNHDHSHVVFAHNSLANQGLFVRADSLYGSDEFCMIGNNVTSDITNLLSQTLDVQISDNHIFAGAVGPGGATGTTVGGDQSTLFANSEIGDFAPLGELLLDPKSPTVLVDLLCAKRATSGAAGAVGKTVI